MPEEAAAGSARLLWAILGAVVVLLGCVIYNTSQRWGEAERLGRENVALKVEVEKCQSSVSALEVEKERERQLLRIAATQEAEASALARHLRKLEGGREAADFIKSQTRRYLLFHGGFAESGVTPPEIVTGLCAEFAKQGYECY